MKSRIHMVEARLPSTKCKNFINVTLSSFPETRIFLIVPNRKIFGLARWRQAVFAVGIRNILVAIGVNCDVMELRREFDVDSLDKHSILRGFLDEFLWVVDKTGLVESSALRAQVVVVQIDFNAGLLLSTR